MRRLLCWLGFHHWKYLRHFRSPSLLGDEIMEQECEHCDEWREVMRNFFRHGPLAPWDIKGYKPHHQRRERAGKKGKRRMGA